MLVLLVVGSSAQADTDPADSQQRGLIGGCKLKHDERAERLWIESVLEGDHAERSGFRAGDILLTLDGKPLQMVTVREVMDFFLDGLVAGEERTFTVQRGDEQVEVRVVPRPMPDDFEKSLLAQSAQLSEKIRQQDVMNWLKRSTLRGTVTIEVESQGLGRYSVETRGADRQAPEGLLDWLLASASGAELRALAVGETSVFAVSRNQDGQISFETIFQGESGRSTR